MTEVKVQPLFIVTIDEIGQTDVEFVYPKPITTAIAKRAIKSVQVRYRQYQRQLIKNRRKQEMQKCQIQNPKIKTV